MNNLTSLSERLLSGEKVECLSCHKGQYLPLNPEFEMNHTYQCPECGDSVHIEANVTVE